MRHIAEKTPLHLPPDLDVLLCEQEVIADDTPAYQMVLKSDKKRVKLEEELKKLEENQKEDENQERINEIFEELHLMNADSAEGRARRILAGLGFTTREMQNRATKNFR